MRTPGSGRRQSAAMIYKLCSLLLLYPEDAQLQAARAEIASAVESLPRSQAASAIARFFQWWSSTDLLEASKHYVQTLEMGRRSGLYLTYYGEGDTRKRGQALLRLKRLYRSCGLPLSGSELPDYLPVMLEFAASAPPGRGELVLREHHAALELLRLSLHDLATPYANLLDAVCLTLGSPSAADRERVVKLAAEGPPGELVGLEPASSEALVGLAPFSAGELTDTMEAR